ncbi:GH3 auxin-responsive promoter family protein, partial [Flavobacteriaceae bacterium]|nr:GH3 auxin-responsive promoter family protein [Flavobacteriaceae bacterium]
PLMIISVQKGGFKKYMEAEGKLGGQNKLPRLSNDREIVDRLSLFVKRIS